MPAHPETVVSALALALRSDPSRPHVTMYDERTGERVELSVATFDNWVCKLANLFTSEWELEPGNRVAILLPPHWQAMVTAVAAWTAGLTVSLGDEGGAAALVVGPEWSGGSAHPGPVLACSLRPLGGRFLSGPPPGATDWADEVPAQPDLLLMPTAIAENDPALMSSSGVVSHRDLLERGRAAAARIGLDPGGRLLTDQNPSTPDGIDVALLAPLVADASVVLLVAADRQRAASIAQQERVTCTAVAADSAPTQEKTQP